MTRTITVIALACAALVVRSGSLSAQVLNDPTRPPVGIYAAETNTGVAAGQVLQSVMITPTSRSAMIGGELVKLNGKYGEARVIKISEGEVVLKSSSGTETLRMYPGVEMTPVKPPAPKPQTSAHKQNNIK
jgi:MSHA biogenesis protein MshK